MSSKRGFWVLYRSIGCVLVCLALVLLLSPSTYARFESDSRIRTYVYDNTLVFDVPTAHGYQTSIVFGEEEQMLTLSLGDSLSFKVTPSGNRLFIKPNKDSHQTNMTVVTTERAYHFELRALPEEQASDAVYVVRFYYPEEDLELPGSKNHPLRAYEKGPINLKKPPAPAPRGFQPGAIPRATPPLPPRQHGGSGSRPGTNYAYSLSGNAAFAPKEVFDNGKQTFFTFAPGAVAPSFYLVTPQGQEIPVAATRNQNQWVLDRIHPRFSLRFGPEVICIFNERMLGQPSIPGMPLALSVSPSSYKG